MVTEIGKVAPKARTTERIPPKPSKPPLDFKPPQHGAKQKDIGVSYMRARAVTSGHHLVLRCISITQRTFARTRGCVCLRDESEEHAGRHHLSNISDVYQKQRQHEVSAGTIW